MLLLAVKKEKENDLEMGEIVIYIWCTESRLIRSVRLWVICDRS